MKCENQLPGNICSMVYSKAINYVQRVKNKLEGKQNIKIYQNILIYGYVFQT